MPRVTFPQEFEVGLRGFARGAWRSARPRAVVAFALVAATSLFLAGCGGGTGGDSGPQPGFTFLVSPSSVLLYPGGTQSVQVQLVGQNGFQGRATVSFAGLPTDVTADPSSFQLSPGESATVVLTAGLRAGTERFQPYSIGNDSAAFTVTVRGIADSIRGAASLNLTVRLQNPAFVPEVTDLPVVWITTQGGAPITDTETYVPGSLAISSDLAGANVLYSGTMQIKGRGHSTWWMPKKPYRIKLDTKASLLGMPTERDWNLLANYCDKTLLRNAVAFELSRRLGMPWTPRSAFVEVFLNGRYDGTYQLTEKIEAGPDRVDITRMAATDTAGDALTGGYLMEIDERLDGATWFYTPRQVPIVIQDPDPAVPQQLDYIRSYVTQAEDALYSSAFADPALGWPAYFDAGTFIDWFLVNETAASVDAIFFSSCWLYKHRMDPLLRMGPVWDFDISMGNVNYSTAVNPAGWWVRLGPWYSRLFQDPNFAAAVAVRWNAVKATELDTLPAFVDQTAAALALAQQNNFQRWPILGQWVWPNSECAGSYAGEIDFVKSWLTQRIAWMDAQFQ
jgi:hypothetical protein